MPNTVLRLFPLWKSGRRPPGSFLFLVISVLILVPVLSFESWATDKQGTSVDQPGASAPKPAGDLYALVVGVAKYEAPEIEQLDFAANDAKAVGKLLHKQEHLFKKKHIKVLIDEKATKRAIEKFLTRDIRNSGKDDTIILFFSGHGIYDPERTTGFYFCPYDTEFGYLAATGVKMSGLEFLKGLDTKRVLVIADACHAGGFSEWNAKSLPPNLEIFMRDFRDSTGRVIITSAGPNQQSYEMTDVHGQPLKNGVFTHYLIKGLEGRADTNRDGRVTVNEVYEYAYEMTKEATEGRQHPQVEGRHSGTFPIWFSGTVIPPWKLKRSLIHAIESGNLNRVKQLRAELLDITSSRDGRNRTSLIVAAEKGHLPIVRLLLDQRPDLEATSDSGNTALIAASSKGKTEVVKLLLQKGANPNAKNKKDESALTLAAREGHPPVVKLLLDGGSNVKAINHKGSTALALASRWGHAAIVKLLLTKGADATVEDFSGRTALSYAGRYGHPDVVNILMAKLPKAKSLTPKHDVIRAVLSGDTQSVKAALDMGAKVDTRTSSSDTPLTLAAGLGHAKVVKLLLERGADVNSRIRYDATALTWAAYNGETEVVSLLLDNGAKVNAKNKGGSTPLSYAARNGHKEIVELLCAHGARINHRSKPGNTPLILASEKGHEEIVKILLEKDADPAVVNKEGYTALIRASENGHTQVVKILLAGATKVNARNVDQYSALMFASANGHKKIVKLLLAKGAAADLKNLKGATALFLASRNGHAYIVEMLLKKGANPHAETREGVTPVSIASDGGHKKIVRLLKDAGTK